MVDLKKINEGLIKFVKASNIKVLKRRIRYDFIIKKLHSKCLINGMKHIKSLIVKWLLDIRFIRSAIEKLKEGNFEWYFKISQSSNFDALQRKIEIIQLLDSMI